METSHKIYESTPRKDSPTFIRYVRTISAPPHTPPTSKALYPPSCQPTGTGTTRNDRPDTEKRAITFESAVRQRRAWSATGSVD